MISHEIIEARANLVRRKLGIVNASAFDIYNALETLQRIAKNFSFRIGTIEELGTDEAIMDYDSDTLIAHNHVFEDLKSGRARARFTFAHELGHFFLGHEGRRARNKDKRTYKSDQQRIAEAEANIFASYFLVPTDLAVDAASADEIADRFQVSLEAAEIAFERIQTARRRQTGAKRQLPEGVVDYLKERRARGLPVKTDLSDYD